MFNTVAFDDISSAVFLPLQKSISYLFYLHRLKYLWVKSSHLFFKCHDEIALFKGENLPAQTGNQSRGLRNTC